MAPDANIGAFASRFVDVENTPWIESGPGNKMKVLHRDPESGLLTIITKLAPGGMIPMHTHEDLEQTYILEGSLVDDEGACSAGNFVVRQKGSQHQPVAPNGCTMLVFFMKPTPSLLKLLAKHGL
jgi:anti-sigma factor ChrR (cupin superfamily)